MSLMNLWNQRQYDYDKGKGRKKNRIKKFVYD